MVPLKSTQIFLIILWVISLEQVKHAVYVPGEPITLGGAHIRGIEQAAAALGFLFCLIPCNLRIPAGVGFFFGGNVCLASERGLMCCHDRPGETQE